MINKRIVLSSRQILRVLCVCLILGITGCINRLPTSAELRDLSRQVNYANPHNWFICENDPDNSPAIDIFVAYPTIVSHKEPAYMDWSDETTRKKAEWFIPQMTGIFAPLGRIFVPYHRQTEYNRAILALKQKSGNEIFAPGINDLKDAFRYYLKNYNGGRPFILFGYSQGAMLLLEVMRSELKDPEVNKLLVAAYLIGYPKMPKKFPDAPHLRTARGSVDTGVIINWNSIAPGGKDNIFTGGEYYCINPLNWRTDDFPASELYSKGAVFFDKNGKISGEFPRFCATQIDLKRGGLIIRPPKQGSDHEIFDQRGSLHFFDLFLFYRDITANAKMRINIYQYHHPAAEQQPKCN